MYLIFDTGLIAQEQSELFGPFKTAERARHWAEEQTGYAVGSVNPENGIYVVPMTNPFAEPFDDEAQDSAEGAGGQIVMTGNPLDGWRFVGPFQYARDAGIYRRKTGGILVEVVDVSNDWAMFGTEDDEEEEEEEEVDEVYEEDENAEPSRPFAESPPANWPFPKPSGLDQLPPTGPKPKK